MTHMVFDSHQGWVQRAPSFTPLRSFGSGAPRIADPKTAPIESREFVILLDQARAGDLEAQAELRFRGQNYTRPSK